MAGPVYNDHFSTVADDYARFRPVYPAELYAWLSELCRHHELAVDVGTGNGQAAMGLVRHFLTVVATDPSVAQLAAAKPHERVRYAEAPADRLPLEDPSADLVTAAAAAHWFPQEAFHAEVRRVLRPGGIVALWTYWRAKVTPAVDAVPERLQSTLVGPYWPPERRYVNSAYRELPFPFEELEAPRMDLAIHCGVEHFIGYLGTWSAVVRYKREHGTDPVDLVRNDLLAAWGHGEREVRWPLAIRVGQV